jgi:hypothetical protein
MAIHAEFGGQDPHAKTERVSKNGNKWIQSNNMWTAFHENGPAYGTAELRWFRPDAPKVFRYQK